MKVLFWSAAVVLCATGMFYGLDLFHDNVIGNCLVGIAGGLSLLYIIHVTDKSVDRKFDAWWSQHYDGCDHMEIIELNEHMDGLVDACNENNGSAIALSRKRILEVVAEIQNDRRTNRK